MKTDADFKVISEIKQVLTKNRAEQIGMDVWGKYVIPPFYRTGLYVSNMPARIEGGRGSGKTMLLRYLSYQSQFSSARSPIPKDALKSIGLYWKADTQFLRMMQKRGNDEDWWQDIFSHYVTLKITKEVVECILFVSKSNCEGVGCLSTAELPNFSRLLVDYKFESSNLETLALELQSLLRKTEIKIGNFRSADELIYLPSTFVVDFIRNICLDVDWLSNTVFRVYVDEYENLLPYQQRVINTAIKHSEPPLVYNIAIKKNGMSERGTLGDQQIENRADYEVFDIDKMMRGESCDVYFSEIFLKRLSEVQGYDVPGLDVSILSDVDKVAYRSRDEYKKVVIDIMGGYLPKRSHDDLADEIFENSGYKAKLVKSIERALAAKGSDLDPGFFIDDGYRKASIVNSSLLNRNTSEPENVLAEFKLHVSGAASKFVRPSDWLHNYFVGSYLKIVTQNKDKCSFYSGFDVYVQLSDGNVRHFLELCRTAFSLVEYDIKDGSISIKSYIQNMAARITAEELYQEIVTFTPRGRQLQQLVLGLGRLFSDFQRRDSQSEPEVTHFYMPRKNEGGFDDDTYALLSEAEKWGVLRKDEQTKAKSGALESDYEFILNPVYSPFFGISYRKGRRCALTEINFKQLCNGQNIELKTQGLINDQDSPVQGDLL